MKLPKIHPIAAIILKTLLVASVVALVVAGVYELCEPYIHEKRGEVLHNAMSDVFGDRQYDTLGEAFDWDGAVLTPASSSESAQTFPSLPHGFAAEVTVGGYAGDIHLLVGIALESGDTITPVVTGVRLVEHVETAGSFASGDPTPFLEQFENKQSDIVLNGQENSVDAVSGATITSRAITDGVNNALDAVRSYVLSQSGGVENEE